jgi:hypothetical protein
MRLQPYRQPSPISELFDRIIGSVQQANQNKLQQWQMQRQMQMQEQARQQDAQERDDRLRLSLLGQAEDPNQAAAPLLDRLGMSGLKLRNPLQERQQQEERESRQMLGQGLMREAFGRENPGRVLDVAQPLLRGQQPPQMPGYNYTGTGSTGGFPRQIAPESGITAAFRNNRPLEQVLAEQRATAAETKAAGDRASREKIAQERVAAMLQAAGMRADAQTLTTASRFFLENWDATGNPLYAEQNTQAFLQRFRPQPRQPGTPLTPRLGAEVPGGEGLTPFGAPVVTPAMQRAETGQQNADTNAQRAGTYAKSVDATIANNKARTDLVRRGQDLTKQLRQADQRLKAIDQEIRRQQINLTDARARERTGLDRQRLEWQKTYQQSILNLRQAAGGEGDPNRKAKIQSLLDRAEALEKQANDALMNDPNDQNGLYARLRKGSLDLFSEANALMEQGARRPQGSPQDRQAIQGMLDTFQKPGADPQRPTRLKYVQEFRTRYKREPSAAEINQIADAVKRGLLK